jgi:hypothetical protein
MNEILLNESNYFSPEMSLRYCGSSQFKDFTGIRGITGCEAKALAKLRGEWKDEIGIALLVGSYVDAHFEGTLDVFKAKNPQIFKTTGDRGLKSDFVHALKIIERCERDPLFMQFMSGSKQVIMTANVFGMDWKIKIDVYHHDKAIVDGKVMKSIKDKFYLKDQGYVNFIEYWGYDYQAAIYQMVVEANTGKQLPFYIAAASKESEPDIEVIQIEQTKINEAKTMIEAFTPRIIQLKNGEVEPIRCNECDYCRSTKVLEAPIWSSELMIGL